MVRGPQYIRFLCIYHTTNIGRKKGDGELSRKQTQHVGYVEKRQDQSMSEELFENVLGQNLLHVLDSVKTGDRSSDYFSALEDFERYTDNRKLAEPIDYEGVGDNAEKD